MIRMAAMMIAGTAKLASSLVACGGYPEPSIARRRSRSGRSSSMTSLLGRRSCVKNAQRCRKVRMELGRRLENRGGCEFGERAPSASEIGGKPAGDGAKLARYKRAR